MTDFRNTMAAALGISGLALVGATAAQAVENGTLQYPAGSSGFTSAALPPMPGFYFLSQTSFSSADRLNDAHGDKLPIPFKLGAAAQTLRGLYVSNQQVLGGQVWGQVVLPLVNLDLTTPAGKGSDFSLADVTGTVGLVWHLSRSSTVAAGLDVVFPTGSYSASRIANVGQNHGSLQPTVAYHYTAPSGWEFAASLRAIFNDRNDATDYKSGDVIVADYAVGYKVGDFCYGVSGYYLKQISDDTGPTAPPGGNRAEGFGIGPSISYVPNPATMITLSLQNDLVARNLPQGTTLQLAATLHF